MYKIIFASVAVVALSGSAFAGGGGGGGAPVGPPGLNGTAGYGNATASLNGGQGNGAGRDAFTAWGPNFIGSHAEHASGKSPTSDVGEGRERADEANPNGDGCQCD